MGYILSEKQIFPEPYRSQSATSGYRQHDFVLLLPDKNSFNYRRLTCIIGLEIMTEDISTSFFVILLLSTRLKVARQKFLAMKGRFQRFDTEVSRISG